MIPGKNYKPEDLLLLAWRRKWLIVIPCLVCGLGAAAWARVQPDLYSSETVILVVPARVPENYVRSTVTARLEDRLQSINQQILSRTRLERIINDFDLYPEMRRTRFMEQVVEEMRRNIYPEIVKGDAFKISYVSLNPVQAMQVTQRLASLYIEENLKDREVQAAGTNQFLESQLQEARQRLIEHEKKLEAYNRQHSGELPNQMASNLQALNGAQMQLQAIVESLNRDRDRRSNLERMLVDAEASLSSGTFDSVLHGPAGPIGPLANIAAQLDAARKELQALQLRLKPAHPDIARARKQVEELEKKRRVKRAPQNCWRPTYRRRRVTNPTTRPASHNRPGRDECFDQQIAGKELDRKRLHDVIATCQSRIDDADTRVRNSLS
jgi:uncharacterized protein involved in exopolysaccharide biosynthesis